MFRFSLGSLLNIVPGVRWIKVVTHKSLRNKGDIRCCDGRTTRTCWL